MKFFAIHIQDLESEAFTTATNDQIATWLFLHGLCCKQQNSGTIQGADTIPERFWSRHCINRNILASPSPLWTWNGPDLSVHPYDIKGQTIFAQKVEGGKVGAARRWEGAENRTPNRTPNGPDPTRPNSTQPDQRQADSALPSLESPPGKNDLAEAIWAITPPKGRERSSKATLANAIKAIPKSTRPTDGEIVAALKGWCLSESWTQDGGAFVPGIHRWVRERRWESVPEPAKTVNTHPAKQSGGGTTQPALNLGGRQPAAVIRIPRKEPQGAEPCGEGDSQVPTIPPMSIECPLAP